MRAVTQVLRAVGFRDRDLRNPGNVLRAVAHVLRAARGPLRAITNVLRAARPETERGDFCPILLRAATEPIPGRNQVTQNGILSLD